jgi:dTDP-4-dehydrorhamnose 3,5-epimerase
MRSTKAAAGPKEELMTHLQPIKDPSTVTPEGQRKMIYIDGVRQRSAITHADERGTLTEILNSAWPGYQMPLTYVYQTSVLPGKIRGWVVHYRQTDRLFISQGFLKIVLYDSRPESSTFGLINEIYLTEQTRGLLTIPPHVFHAVQNIGTKEAVFINLPTIPYNHEDPDKYRLPLDTNQIPYQFGGRPGW